MQVLYKLIGGYDSLYSVFRPVKDIESDVIWYKLYLYNYRSLHICVYIVFKNRSWINPKNVIPVASSRQWHTSFCHGL